MRALVLAARIAGDHVAQTIQLGMDAPRPPFQSGSPDTAPRAIVEVLRRHRDAVLRH
jgi:cyclohexyl-isocyanide hydratase